MTGLPQKAFKGYQVEELAIMWAIPVPTIVGWVRDGSLATHEDGRLTHIELLDFINSDDGQQLLRYARS